MLRIVLREVDNDPWLVPADEWPSSCECTCNYTVPFRGTYKLKERKPKVVAKYGLKGRLFSNGIVDEVRWVKWI